MNSYRDPSGFGCFIAISAAVTLVILGIAWYQAGVQTEVYRRQNVEMTQWEVFVGCTPAERQIHFEKPDDRERLEQNDTR